MLNRLCPRQYLLSEVFLHICHHLQLLRNYLGLKMYMLIFSLKGLDDLTHLVNFRRLTAF